MDQLQPIQDASDEISIRGSAAGRLHAALAELAVDVTGPFLRPLLGSASAFVHSVAVWCRGHALVMPHELRTLAGRLRVCANDTADADLATRLRVALARSAGSHYQVCTQRCRGDVDKRPMRCRQMRAAAVAADSAVLAVVE